MTVYTPFAFTGLLVPWNKHIIRLHGSTLLAEFLGYPGEQLLSLRRINNRNTI